MYTCICIYACVYVYVCMCVYVWLYVYVCMYVCVCVSVCGGGECVCGRGQARGRVSGCVCARTVLLVRARAHTRVRRRVLTPGDVAVGTAGIAAAVVAGGGGGGGGAVRARARGGVWRSL